MIVETITGPSATGKSECAREMGLDNSEQAKRPRYVFDITGSMYTLDTNC